MISDGGLVGQACAWHGNLLMGAPSARGWVVVVEGSLGRPGWAGGESSWSPQAQRFQTGWLCQGVGVGVIVGCPVSSQGAGPSFGLAGRGDRAGQGGKLLSPAWSTCCQSFKENWDSCLDGLFLIPCPSDGAIKAGAFGGLWNEVSPIVASHRLDQNLRPQTRANGANVLSPNPTQGSISFH